MLRMTPKRGIRVREVCSLLACEMRAHRHGSSWAFCVQRQPRDRRKGISMYRTVAIGLCLGLYLASHALAEPVAARRTTARPALNATVRATALQPVDPARGSVFSYPPGLS